MKLSKFAFFLWAVCFLTASAYSAFPFNYQGRLYDDGSPADGKYDFSFVLLSMDDPDSHKGMVSEFFDCNKVPVSNGYFTVELDFIPHPPNTEDDLFDGSDRWLSIHVIPSDSEDPNDYQQLLPLPKITAAPYAHLSYGLKTPAVLYDETESAVLTLGNDGTGAAVLYADDEGLTSFNNNAMVDVAHDLTALVGNSHFLTVAYDSTQDYGRNRAITVGMNETKTISGDCEMTVGINRNITIGGMEKIDITGDCEETVGIDRNLNVGNNSVTTAGRNIQIEAANEISLLSQEPIKLQDGLFVSRSADDLMKVSGAITMWPMTEVPAPTAGYGKVYVDNADGKLYYIDTSEETHDLTAVADDRVSFSVKRDVSYTWPAGSSFEIVDFTSDTAIWDNTGGGFNGKSGAFKAPAEGLYTFHGSIFFTGLSRGDLIAAAVNAEGKRYRGDAKTAGGPDESAGVNITVYLEAGDTAALEGYVQSASKVNVMGAGGADAFTYFNGARVD